MGRDLFVSSAFGSFVVSFLCENPDSFVVSGVRINGIHPGRRGLNTVCRMEPGPGHDPYAPAPPPAPARAHTVLPDTPTKAFISHNDANPHPVHAPERRGLSRQCVEWGRAGTGSAWCTILVHGIRIPFTGGGDQALSVRRAAGLSTKERRSLYDGSS